MKISAKKKTDPDKLYIYRRNLITKIWTNKITTQSVVNSK